MTTPKRRWFRWSLRTLFVVVALVAVLLTVAPPIWRSYERWAIRRQQAAEAARIDEVMAKLTKSNPTPSHWHLFDDLINPPRPVSTPAVRGDP